MFTNRVTAPKGPDSARGYCWKAQSEGCLAAHDLRWRRDICRIECMNMKPNKRDLTPGSRGKSTDSCFGSEQSIEPQGLGWST